MNDTTLLQRVRQLCLECRPLDAMKMIDEHLKESGQRAHVLVGVITNSKGEYFALGYNSTKEEIRRTLISDSDMDCKVASVSWVDAYVPIPTEATVEGRVQ